MTWSPPCRLPALRPLPALLGGLALTLATGLALAALPGEAPDLEPCAEGAALQAAVVERLNALRRRADVPCAGTAMAAARPLAWEARLAASAHEQAVDLALHDRLSHVDALQRGFATRLHSVGYRAAGAGENLAAGQASVDDTLQAWLASPSHCANLMQPEFSDVGLACVQRRGSRYERFWVAHLGAPQRR